MYNFEIYDKYNSDDCNWMKYYRIKDRNGNIIKDKLGDGTSFYMTDKDFVSKNDIELIIELMNSAYKEGYNLGDSEGYERGYDRAKVY